MKKWDFGDDENDQLAREAGIDPCDLDTWRSPTWTFLQRPRESLREEAELPKESARLPVGEA